MESPDQAREIPGPMPLQQQAERLLAQLRPVLVDPQAEMPSRLTAGLFDFYISARERQHHVQAGETARSLASLLHNWGDRPLRAQERLQVAVLVDTLLQDLSPRHEAIYDEHRPLVTPIPPSSATVNWRVALYVDNADVLVILRETLSAAGFEPVVFDSLDALAGVNEESAPAAIVAELSVCRLNPKAATVFANLRDRFALPPHLVCIAPAADIAARLDAVRLGATRVLGLPIDAARLVALLKGVTEKVPRRPFSVVMIDDDPFVAEVCRSGLEDAGISVQIVHDPLRAPELIREIQPDLVICDIFMPGCNGLELLALLRQYDELMDLPIILLSSDPEIERRLEALNLGADDFLMKPVDVPLLTTVVIARARRSRALRRTRSELHWLQQRVRVLESGAPQPVGNSLSTVDFEGSAEKIDLDDYVVSVVDAVGARRWSRSPRK